MLQLRKPTWLPDCDRPNGNHDCYASLMLPGSFNVNRARYPFFACAFGHIIRDQKKFLSELSLSFAKTISHIGTPARF